MSNNAQIEPQKFQQTAYMDLAVNESTPVIKAAAQYGLLDDVNPVVGPSGVITTINSSFHCESGIDPNGFAAVSTKNSLIFRPGQGEKDLFTARFTAGQVNSEQFSGLVNANAAIGFGYNGTEFGILLRAGGAVEIQELTITTPAGGSENATVTVDGVGYTVPLTSGTVQHNAVEMETSLMAQVPLWFFEAVDDQVVASSLISAPIAGAFAFTSSSAVAAWVQIASGVLPIDSWINQADWDDPIPELIISNFNNYKVQVGPSVGYFSIFSSTDNEYKVVHTINTNNTSEVFTISNPTFGHTWYALNRGSTTSVTTEGSYCGLFREGPNVILRPTASDQQILIGVSTTPLPIMSFRARFSMNGVINLARAIISGIQVTSDSSKTIVATLIADGTLTDPVFQYVNKTNSILELDTSATAVTGGTSISLTGLNEIVISDLETILNSGDLFTIAVNVTANPASEFVVTTSYLEDL